MLPTLVSGGILAPKRAGRHNLAAGVHGDAGELAQAIWASEGTEVAIAQQVKRANGAVAACTDHCVALGRKTNGVHRGGVLCEGDETKAALSVEQLHLAIVST